MREFNLTEALNGWPICTRDGRKAELVAGNELSMLIVKIEGAKNNSLHYPDGKWRPCKPSSRDLFLCENNNQQKEKGGKQ